MTAILKTRGGGFFGKDGRQITQLERDVRRNISDAKSSQGVKTSNGIPVESGDNRMANPGDHIVVANGGTITLPRSSSCIGQSITIDLFDHTSGACVIYRSDDGLINGQDVDSLSFTFAIATKATFTAYQDGWRVTS